MKWADVADTVSKFAPGVGASLAGPLGGAVGVAVATALGRGDSPTPDAVYDAVRSNPESAKILAQLDIKRIEQEIEYAQAELEDRKSARELQAEAIRNGRGEFQNWLAAGVLLVGALMLCAIVFVPPESISDNLRMYVLGFLTAAMMQVLNYFFGSTQWGNKIARGPAQTPPRRPNMYDEVGWR